MLDVSSALSGRTSSRLPGASPDRASCNRRIQDVQVRDVRKFALLLIDEISERAPGAFLENVLEPESFEDSSQNGASTFSASSFSKSAPGVPWRSICSPCIISETTGSSVPSGTMISLEPPGQVRSKICRLDSPRRNNPVVTSAKRTPRSSAKEQRAEVIRDFRIQLDSLIAVPALMISTTARFTIRFRRVSDLPPVRQMAKPAATIFGKYRSDAWCGNRRAASRPNAVVARRERETQNAGRYLRVLLEKFKEIAHRKTECSQGLGANHRLLH